MDTVQSELEGVIFDNAKVEAQRQEHKENHL